MDNNNDNEVDDGFSQEVHNILSDDYSSTIMEMLQESENGQITTSEVRDRTGLGNDKTRYRFRRLEECGLINKEYDNSLTPKGKSPMTVVSLTRRGRRAIVGGVIGETVKEDNEVEKTPEEKLQELKDDFREFKSGEWKRFIEWATDIEERLSRLENKES